MEHTFLQQTWNSLDLQLTTMFLPGTQILLEPLMRDTLEIKQVVL